MKSIINSIVSSVYSILIPPPRFIEKGVGNKITFCDGHLVRGMNNRIIVKNNSLMNKCKFVINGNNNTIIIGNECRLSGTTFWIQDDNNFIQIGDKTSIGSGTELAALEGTRIEIGKDCMLSDEILIRTSDSHSIMDKDQKRINHAKNIVIGNHCWIGLQCLIMKGAAMGDNSILGARSILTRPFSMQSCILTGSPARVIRENVNWDRKRL